MAEIFYCDVCNAPMKFIERVKSDKKYRIRRFKCTICDYQRTVFASDTIDSVIEPNKATKAIKKQFKQESNNRTF